MNLRFIGGAEEVTGSCFLGETENGRFLVDCGLHQGADPSDEDRPFPFKPRELDRVILTHAHIDHSGMLPRLYKDGFRGEITATKATADLCTVMLPDSGHIQESEAEWRNRKGKRAGRPPVEPLYTKDDAEKTLRLFRGVNYGDWFDVLPGLKGKFFDAGHILGSATLVLQGEGKWWPGPVVFSGDLGNRDQAIIRDPQVPEEADVVIMESTYGDRNHEPSDEKVAKLARIVQETVREGGNVVIPAFSIGRTQEILFSINLLIEDARIPEVPVFVDSPLAISGTEIFARHSECFDAQTRDRLDSGDLPFEFPNLQFTRSIVESRAINQVQGAVIISASGMCSVGRIKHHLKHNLWRPESTVLFVGFQAQGSLGRRISDGEDQVTLFGEKIAVKSRIERISGFSAHADREGLLTWLGAIGKPPQRVFLVHGESEAAESLATAIDERFDTKVLVPSRDESVNL